MPPSRRPAAILDHVRSAANVGAILRSADCAGLDWVALCGYTPTPPNPKLAKTALGAESTVIWHHHEQVEEGIARARGEGRMVVALETTRDARELYDCQLALDCAIVVGHEVFGVSPEALALVDLKVQIPMVGTKSSLNAATAFGVVAFELLRRARGRENS